MTISYQPPEGLAQMTAGVQTAQKRAAALAALIVPFNDQKLPVKVWDEAAAKSVKPAVGGGGKASLKRRVFVQAILFPRRQLTAVPVPSALDAGNSCPRILPAAGKLL